MGRRLPYSQVIPDSEDEEELDIDSAVAGITVAVAESSTNNMEHPVESRSSSVQDPSFSQPAIAFLAEASEIPGATSASARLAAAISGVPKSLLRGSSPSTIESATPLEKPKPRPRPRPRVVNPGALVNQTNPLATPSSISNTTPPQHPSAAGPSSARSDPVAEFSSSIPGLDYGNRPDLVEPYTSDIAERAKLRSRATTSSKAAGKKRAAPDPDIIELSSDSDDELSFLPSKKSKGKEKASANPRKRTKKTQEDQLQDSTLSSRLLILHCPRLRQLYQNMMYTLLLMTLLFHLLCHFPSVDAIERNRLSPLWPTMARTQLKRKRCLPPFFADSSSLAPALSAPSPLRPSSPSPPAGKDKASAKGRGRKRKAAQSDEESDWEEDTSRPSKTKPKPRARKRKAVRDDEEEWDGDEPHVPSPKPKAKKQPARRKKAEVVIKPRSRTSTTSVSPAKRPADLPPAESSPTRASSTLNGDDADQDALHGLAKDPESAQPKPAKSKSSKAKGKNRATIPSEESRTPPLPPDEGVVKDKVDERGSAGTRAPSPDDARGQEETSTGGEKSSPDTKVKSVKDVESQNTRAPSSSAMSRTSNNTYRAYRIPRRDNRSVSEILRKVASQPGSPFTTTRPHSPLAKMSRSAFRNVVPLHPHRRTPPPPPPRPPPPKKTKKQLELEEKWEMELEDTVEGWYCLTEEERTQLRRAKRDAEMGYED
ncbi:hypothetical protein NM688_g1631 [Phlebia brevispora]|uniref:Uncharacterized protein n=1 Tax=Phlebia brevispora TaxID=194682 RepID=A0ACC1TAR8_9APHY|nr:hypothetical protein NM688_g1631 [Phlebia brevispora]